MNATTIDMTAHNHVKKAGDKFHPPSRSPHGHTYAIDDHGLAVQLDLGSGPTEITGEQAQHLREWLSKCELRTQSQHDAVQAEAAANPPQEVNSGIKVEMNDHSVDPASGTLSGGTHKFAQTREELELLEQEARSNLIRRNQAQNAALVALDAKRN